MAAARWWHSCTIFIRPIFWLNLKIQCGSKQLGGQGTEIVVSRQVVFIEVCRAQDQGGSHSHGSLEPTNEWNAMAKLLYQVRALRKQYGFDAMSLMPTNLYGPGDNYHSTEMFCLLCCGVFMKPKNIKIRVITCLGWFTFKEFLHVDDLYASVFALRCQYKCVLCSLCDTFNHLYLNVGTERSQHSRVS